MSRMTTWRRSLALGASLIVAQALPSFAAEAERVAQAASDCADAKSHFEAAREIGTREAMQVHIDSYGGCSFAPLARMLIGRLPTSGDAPAPKPAASVAKTPAQPPVDAEARRVADGFVALLNEARLATGGPKGEGFEYESATTIGGDTKIIGLQHLTRRNTYAEQSRVRFAETLLVKPSLSATGGFSAERVEATGLESTERSPREDAWSPFRNSDKFQMLGDSVRLDGLTILPGGEGAPDALGAHVRLKGIEVKNVVLKKDGAPFVGLASLTATADRIEKGLPYQLKAEIGGLSLSRRMMETSGDLETRKVSAALGLDAYVFGFSLDFGADSATRKISINSLSTSMAQGFASSLILRLSDIDLAEGLDDLRAGGRPNGVLKKMNIDFATISVIDLGLFPKLLDFAAAASGVNVDLLKTLGPAQAQAVALQFLGDQKMAEEIRDSASDFMASPSRFRATLAPDRPANVWELFSGGLRSADDARQATIALRATVGVGSRPDIALFRPLLLASLPPEAREAIESCHQLAADSDDPQKLAPGVKSPGDIDHAKALPACTAAQKADPTDPMLAFELGRSYYAAGKPEVANTYYRLAAIRGHKIAMYELASAELNGSGMTADPAAAIKSFEAIEDDLPLARAMLASIYVNGTGVPADPKKAIEIWQTGADKGEVESQYNLGVEYMLGTNVAADPAKGHDLLQKAADQNHPDAMGELAKSFFRGDGGAQPDYASALKWAEKAAEADSAIGQSTAGLILASGVGGIAKDPDKAAELLLKALAKGDPDAAAYLVTDKAKDFDKAFRRAVQVQMKKDGAYEGPTTGLFGRQTMEALETIRDTAKS